MSKNVGWKQIHEALLGLAQRASELDWEILVSETVAEAAACEAQHIGDPTGPTGPTGPTTDACPVENTK